MTATPSPAPAPVAAPRRVAAESPLRRAFEAIGLQNVSLLIALAVLVAIISTQTDKFWLPANLLNIGVAVSLVGLVAIVQTVVIVSGGLDISVGSVAGLASVAAALALQATGNQTLLGILAAVVAGIACGAINGLVITVLRVNPVIATLATLSAFRGVALLFTNGSAVGVLDERFNDLGSGRPLGIPFPILILVVFAVLIHVLLRYTVWGRNIYAIGGNPVAARLSGVDLNRYRLAVYVLSGIGAAIAGIVLTARTHSGQPQSGSQGLELEAVTAALLGGCALNGGKGTIFGTMLAVVLLGTLTNGMILLGIQSFYQLVAKGALLVLAVTIQQYRLSRTGVQTGTAFT
ncbi:MAG: ABC transporter permease [Chloroflexia bacterium]|nr:ABC transporter permease [Chloroflexia bacterium]